MKIEFVCDCGNTSISHVESVVTETANFFILKVICMHCAKNMQVKASKILPHRITDFKTPEKGTTYEKKQKRW